MKDKKRYGLFTVLRRHAVAVFTSSARKAVGLTAALSLTTAVGSVLITRLNQSLFENAAMLDGDNYILQRTVLSLLLLLAARCFFHYVEAAFNICGRNMLKLLERIFDSALHHKAARIDPIEYEKNGMLDLVNQARFGIRQSISLVFIAVLAIAHYLPYYIMMGIYLARLDPLLALALPLSALPPLASLWLRLVYFNKVEDIAAPLRRRYEYFESAITDRDCFKETRTLGIFDFLFGKYHAAVTNFGRVYLYHESKSLRADLALKVLETAAYLSIITLSVHSLLQGHIGVGAFAAVFGAVHTLLASMAELFNGHFGKMATRFSAIRGYFVFMDLPERPGKKSLPAGGGGIRLQDVSFTYPGARRPSLSHVNLEIKDGETVAVVGANGAGKSTLVRLLSGLCLPDDGKVLLFGEDTADIDLAQLFDRTSAVFQDYQRYRYPLSLNVSISDTSGTHSDGDISKALAEADLPLPQPFFPDGENTMLSREFGGQDLSGGQWQRVAIARGLYRPHDLLFLDEPTAAIDPLEEKALYEKFMQMTVGRTAVLVTHRLGSARMADRILVMDGGELAADGTHEQLLEECPLYRQMYNAQADWYK